MASNKQTRPLHLTFGESTRMSDLICDNLPLLQIITRFGIPLGFGEKSIRQVCQDCDVDTPTLLLLLHCSLSGEDTLPLDQLERICLEDLLNYLSNSHSYFLEFSLPLIRQRLLASISNCPKEVSIVIRNFFDEYADEVRKHMSYEERIVFPYARRLASGIKDSNYSIEIFSKRHDQVEMKIVELKNLLIKYYPAPSSFELILVVQDIFGSEMDLAAHNRIEDFIFVPYIQALEQGQIHVR